MAEANSTRLERLNRAQDFLSELSDKKPSLNGPRPVGYAIVGGWGGDIFVDSISFSIPEPSPGVLLTIPLLLGGIVRVAKGANLV